MVRSSAKCHTRGEFNNKRNLDGANRETRHATDGIRNVTQNAPVKHSALPGRLSFRNRHERRVGDAGIPTRVAGAIRASGSPRSQELTPSIPEEHDRSPAGRVECSKKGRVPYSCRASSMSMANVECRRTADWVAGALRTSGSPRRGRRWPTPSNWLLPQSNQA